MEEKSENSASSCPFCAIAAGKLPASIVYRDADWLALMDIHPLRKGHVLIIPQQHLAHLADLGDNQRDQLLALAARLLQAQQQAGFAAGGANLLLNDGSAANQHVPHLHLHCIPRRPGDSLRLIAGLISRVFGFFGLKAARVRLDEQAALLRSELTRIGP
ncbi:MAG: HIT family protein [Rhodanobacteraceae bacterium]|nr:HIT family protein [Rhodanobacteraceae bacterium]